MDDEEGTKQEEEQALHRAVHIEGFGCLMRQAFLLYDLDQSNQSGQLDELPHPANSCDSNDALDAAIVTVGICLECPEWKDGDDINHQPAPHIIKSDDRWIITKNEVVVVVRRHEIHYDID